MQNTSATDHPTAPIASDRPVISALVAFQSIGDPAARVLR